MPVTLKRIAAHCGLSAQTVTCVLNGKAHLFRPETRERVLAAARELGYRPNAAAKAIRSGRFDCIALVLSPRSMESSLFGDFLDGVDRALAEAGLHLVHAPLPTDWNGADDGPKILGQRLADGLLVNYNAGIPPSVVDGIARTGLPAVWVNCQRSADCVHPDDLGAGRMATEHLLALGHRRIAYLDQAYGALTPEVHYSTRDRQTGYETAMRMAGLAPRVLRSATPLSSDRRLASALAWLRADDRPSAVVTYSPFDALPVMHAATALLRLSVPQDLSLVTIDDQPADHLGVAMTTVVIPRYELGREAVAMLLARIAQPRRAAKPRMLPCRLVAGHTSGRVG